MTYDLEYLKSLGFKDPSKFNYNGKTWSAWYHADFQKYLIQNKTDGTKSTTISTWINTIYHGQAPQPIYKIKDETTPTSLNYNDYKSCLFPELLSEEFLNCLEIKSFYQLYQTHSNISTFDFSFCNNRFHLNHMYGKRHILFFDTGEAFYGKYKFNAKSGWLNIKGTKNLGALFNANKASRTLILCEGLKDGINANIAFPTADILVTDSKNIPFKFKEHHVEPKQYQKIILAVDRDVTADEQLNLLYYLNANFYKKVYPLDWKNIPDEITDLTEWLKSLDFTLAKYQKSGLSSLKKIITPNSFYEFYIEKRVEELNKLFEKSVTTNNINAIRRVLKTKNLLGADISKEAEFLIRYEGRANDEQIINLNQNRRLSDFSTEIINSINSNQRTLLNAPTGTGKSYLVKKIFPTKYKNIVTISPLRMVTDEMSENSIFKDVKTIEDLNHPYISITTDVFHNLSSKFVELFKRRVDQSEITIFDEQHIYKESENFREKVVRVYEYLLYRHKGKTLFMSGTPVIPQDIELNIITAKVPNSAKATITYSKNGFEDEKEMIEHIKNELKDGSVMLYCNSKIKVKEVNTLLIKNGINSFSMTSIETKENNKIIKDKKIKFGNYVYISTTKATTGITIPNLKGIYQYGTIFTPNTFIQLLGRLRNGGFFFYIRPKFDSRREHFVKNQAIGVVKGFQKLGVVKLSSSFKEDNFQKWLKNNFYLPFHQKGVEGFLNHFKEAIQVIEAKGLGQLTIEKDDFIFKGIGVINVEEVFDSADSINFKKYIDGVMIDWINQNRVEMLNNIYNLSFHIKEVVYEKSIKKMELITPIEKEQKKERRKEINSMSKEFYKELQGKFKGCLGISTLKKNFSLGELSRLNEMDIDLEEIEKIKHPYDKIVLLKSKLISMSEILKIANKIIKIDGFCLLKDLDNELQKVYIINSRTKMVYLKFLINIFSGKLSNSSGIKYLDRKTIQRKEFVNVLVKQ